MTAVFTVLISLIAVTPLLAFFGGILAKGLVLAFAAPTIALVAFTLQPNEVHRLTRLLKPVAPVLVIPCICMLFQIFPVPERLAHPAWASASAALGKPLLGTVSVDTGMTVLGFSYYLLLLALAIIAAATALNRQRAEIVLFVLVAAATSIAVISIVSELGDSQPADVGFDVRKIQMLDVAVIGLILSSASILRAFESRRTRRASADTANSPNGYALTASIMAFAICLFSITISADAALFLAAICGVGMLAAITSIRWLRFGPWGRSGLVAATIIGLLGFFAAYPHQHKDADLTLVMSAQPANSVATTERMLSDAEWTGTGAGTFEALFPIYRDAGEAPAPPTLAASISIEMGRIFLWTTVILALICAAMLFKQALKRGRDYHYAGIGAGCTAALLIMAFANGGMSGLAASMLASVAFGLAIGQSRSSAAADDSMPSFNVPYDLRFKQ